MFSQVELTRQLPKELEIRKQEKGSDSSLPSILNLQAIFLKFHSSKT